MRKAALVVTAAVFVGLAAGLIASGDRGQGEYLVAVASLFLSVVPLVLGLVEHFRPGPVEPCVVGRNRLTNRVTGWSRR